MECTATRRKRDVGYLIVDVCTRLEGKNSRVSGVVTPGMAI